MGITQSVAGMCLIIMEKNERLQLARKNAGFDSASDAARAMDVSVQTYAAHENGYRSFKEDSARRYARRFGVDVTWLIFGTGTMKPEKGAAVDDLDETDLPDQINLEIFQKARIEARELEKRLTGGGVSDYATYKKLLLMTYRDILEREKTFHNNQNNEHEQS